MRVRAAAPTDHRTRQRLLDAAATRFADGGYQATPVRAIAADAGCGMHVLYTHFDSKQSILAEVIDATHAGAVAYMEVAVALAREDPLDRLDAAIWAHCDFHARQRGACRVAQRELGALEPRHRERLEPQRRRPAEIIAEILAEGAATGVFAVNAPRAMSQTLTSMCAAISLWYDPRVQAGPREVAQAYCGLAARMVGAAPTRGSLAAPPASRTA